MGFNLAFKGLNRWAIQISFTIRVHHHQLVLISEHPSKHTHNTGNQNQVHLTYLTPSFFRQLFLSAPFYLTA
jgi:hypothetical protein